MWVRATPITILQNLIKKYYYQFLFVSPRDNMKQSDHIPNREHRLYQYYHHC